jgi:putative redox protein
MQARGTWVGGFATELDDGRGHRLLVDLPSDEGGRDAGTSALELSLLSLTGCVTTIFALVAAKRRVQFSGLTVDLKAVRPVGSPTIRSVHGTVQVQSEAANEDVETVVRLTLKTCPVGVLFEQAHIPVSIEVVVKPPSAPIAPARVPQPGHA